MGAIGRYLGHVIIAMVKGFVMMVVVSGIICVGVVFAVTSPHRLPHNNIELALIVVIAGLSGLLGAAIALIWRLTHITELTHAVGHLAERLETNNKG